jgi:hypothetical protein
MSPKQNILKQFEEINCWQKVVDLVKALISQIVLIINLGQVD